MEKIENALSQSIEMGEEGDVEWAEELTKKGILHDRMRKHLQLKLCLNNVTLGCGRNLYQPANMPNTYDLKYLFFHGNETVAKTILKYSYIANSCKKS